MVPGRLVKRRVRGIKQRISRNPCPKVGRGVPTAPRRVCRNQIGAAGTPRPTPSIQLITQAKAEIVVRFTVRRIWISSGKSLNRVLKLDFSFAKFATAQMPKTQRIVAAGVKRITPPRLAPIEGRTSRCMAILLQMQAREIEFIVAGDFLRRSGFRRR